MRERYTIEVPENPLFILYTYGEKGHIYTSASIDAERNVVIHVIEHSPWRHKLHFDSHFQLEEGKTEEDILAMMKDTIAKAVNTEVCPDAIGEKYVVVDFRGEDLDEFLERLENKYPIDFKQRTNESYLVALLKGIS